ncbi:TIC 20- chloroplastic [Chlorella sorokiniana]|uniref:Protein TIC 20 n=1 Tax=Chlorella sorokiniana TaxID=3076 RepID=A0A2P6TJ18_CHLSO|nr:TIC 20- chloroplastic [Chlorella sorokiniana]|eukprot:PRW39238.1 TIC 20- chloroplastic [Chlorella sorokiniana]
MSMSACIGRTAPLVSAAAAARPRCLAGRAAAAAAPRPSLAPAAAARPRCLAGRAAAAAHLAPAGLRGGSLSGTALAARPAAVAAPAGRRQLAVAASWNRNSSPEIPDRVVAAIPYLIPLLDGLRYGKFFLVQFPQFSTLLLPLEPLIRLYFSVPFAGLVVFFAVYLGIINNPNFTRYVRYNAMQAILLDIILILPGLIESIVRPPMGGPGLQIYITLYNTIFLFLFACVAYGMGSCATGQTARLPIVADAADAQIR